MVKYCEFRFLYIYIFVQRIFLNKIDLLKKILPVFLTFFYS